MLDGAIPLGLISRPLSAEERSRGLVALPYARTAVVVAANPAVPAQQLTSAQLLALYGGARRHWSDGSRVVVLQREHGDSSHRVFNRLAPGFAQQNERAYRQHRWRVVYSDADMLAALNATEGAVGLLDSGAIQCQGQPLRVLTLDGVEPSLANLDSGAYAFHKDLAFVSAGQPAGMAARFLAFVFSAEGRRLIETNGYLPIGSARSMIEANAGPDIRAQVIARSLGRRLAPLVVLLTAVVSLGTPSAFLAFGLQALRTEARLTARSVAAGIEQESVHDPLWKYNAPKLLAHLKQLRELPKVHRVEIADATGRRVPASEDSAAPGAESFFDLWASAPVVLDGREAGRVWVALSAEDAYASAGLTLGLFSMLGLGLAGLLYWLPLRSARRSGQLIEQLLSQLELSRDELARFNRDLEARVARRSEQLASALDEIQAQEAHLQEVTSRAVALQEAERKAIARDLHDSVGQAMTAIRIHLQILLDKTAETERAGSPAAKALALVDEAIDELRRAVARLGPTVLDDLGLEEALGRFCDDFAERTGLAVERRIAPLGQVLAPALERTCFRIVQEALTNVARHAMANRVRDRLAPGGRPVGTGGRR